jgi:multiple sugar transport system ATP-binding protein
MSLLELGVNGGEAELGGVRIALPAAVAASAGTHVTLGIRPEDVTLGAGEGIAARVKSVEHLGANANATCVVGESDGRELRIVASVDGANPPALEDRVALAPNVGRIHWFSVESGERLPDGR